MGQFRDTLQRDMRGFVVWVSVVVAVISGGRVGRVGKGENLRVSRDGPLRREGEDWRNWRLKKSSIEERVGHLQRRSGGQGGHKVHGNIVVGYMAAILRLLSYLDGAEYDEYGMRVRHKKYPHPLKQAYSRPTYPLRIH